MSQVKVRCDMSLITINYEKVLRKLAETNSKTAQLS